MSTTSLLCSVGARFCALPIEHVVETMRPLPVEALPETRTGDVLRGVAIVRGAALPVIDASGLLGGEVLARPGRFVTVRVAERHLALAVESVLGVRVVPVASMNELAPLLRDAAADVIAKIGALDAQLLVVLRTMRLVPESLWRSLEAREAQTSRGSS